MRSVLQCIAREGPSHRLEETEAGYTLVRRRAGDPEEFNRVARKALELSGEEFVALPRADGPRGYDQVILIPFS